MSEPQIVATLRERFGAALGSWVPMSAGSEYQRRMGSYLEIIEPQSLRDICLVLRDELQFDSLLLLSAVDNGNETLSVVYHVESRASGAFIAMKVTMPAGDATLPSIADVWSHANWQEREAWDMLGIRFEGHPDLRRILLEEDWPGHPLRKNYKDPEFYHGLRVPY